MFKAKSGGSFAAKIAHTSTIPAFGNKDLKLLQDLITNEKTVLTTMQKLAVDLTRASESLKSWGLGEGEDLGDVLSHATNIYAHISTALNNFANHEHTVRAHLKAIRTREERLDETKRRRKGVAAKADAAEKKLSKMSGENKNLPAQTELLNRLRDEIRQLDTDIMVEEARLGDFKRMSTRNFMALKLGGLLEFGEKATIVGELGKLIIEEISLDPTPPGQARSFYQSHPKTENLDAEVARCVGEVVFTPPAEIAEHAYAVPDMRRSDDGPAPDAGAGGGYAALQMDTGTEYRAQTLGELGGPLQNDVVPAGEFGESGAGGPTTHRRFGSGPMRVGDDGAGARIGAGGGGGGQFSTFPVKARSGSGAGEQMFRGVGAEQGFRGEQGGEQSFSASVADALGESPVTFGEGAGAGGGAPMLSVGGNPWDGDEYARSHARGESMESAHLAYAAPESLVVEKGVRFRTPSMEVSGMGPIAPGVASPVRPGYDGEWEFEDEGVPWIRRHQA